MALRHVIGYIQDQKGPIWASVTYICISVSISDTVHDMHNVCVKYIYEVIDDLSVHPMPLALLHDHFKGQIKVHNFKKASHKC